MPGPIDITIGDGGNAQYKVNGYIVGPPKPGNSLDPNFFGELGYIQLINSEKQQAWVVPIVDIRFQDGGRLEAKKAASGTLAWTCFDSKGVPTTLVKGSNGDLPECMARQVLNGEFTYDLNGAPLTGDWIHIAFA